MNQQLTEAAKHTALKNGDEIFMYGFRYFAGFMQNLIQKPKSEIYGMYRIKCIAADQRTHFRIIHSVTHLNMLHGLRDTINKLSPFQ